MLGGAEQAGISSPWPRGRWSQAVTLVNWSLESTGPSNQLDPSSQLDPQSTRPWSQAVTRIHRQMFII